MAKFYALILKIFLPVWVLILTFSSVYAQSGKVFRDFNNNGEADASDIGVKGIVIQSFRTDNTLLATAISGADGLYTLSPAAAPGEAVRVEFSVPDSLKKFFPGAYAPGIGHNGTSVQFIQGPASDVNFAINYPGDFCEATPPVSVVCFVVGSGTTLGDNLLANIPYNANGKDPNDVGHPNAPATTVGAIWGTAFDRETGWLYAASFMRRHTAFGANGTGVIYVTTDIKDPAGSRSFEWLNLNGMTVAHINGGTVTVNTGSDPHMKSDYYLDLINANGNPSDAVGKISFGDMDMSSDGQFLFVVSLNENRLYRIRIDSDKNPATFPTAADVLAYDLPTPACNGGVVRPYGLGVRGDDVYIGTVCDGSISKQYQDLHAYIYKLNVLTHVMTPVIDFTLDYLRGNISGGEFIREHGKWQPWTDDADWTNYNESPGEVWSLGYRWELVCPQALLSDIVFDDDGSLVVAFMDRFGHQGIFDGPDPQGSKRADDNTQFRRFNLRAGGDVLRICNSGTINKPVYDLEQLGKCGDKGGGQYLDATYSPIEYEYYTGDNFNKDSHTETADGALGIVPGTNELIMSAFDPINESLGGDIYSNGYRVLSNTTGQEVRGFQLLTQIPPNNGNNLFGKASGVGGIEVLCKAKSLEIGNRVWIDTNKNGIQDADEQVVPNVILELYNDENQLVGTQVTDAAGTYYFNQGNVIDTAGIFRPNRPGLQVDRRYTIRIPASQYRGRGYGPLYGLTVTTAILRRAFADAPLTDNVAVRDNDAVQAGGLVSATVHTGYSGENDHNIDIGFAPLPPCSLSLVLTPSACNSATNQYTLLGALLTEGLPADGTLTITVGTTSLTVAATASTTSVPFAFTGLTSDAATYTVTATFSDLWCGPVSDTFTAPASCTVPAVVSVNNTTVCAGTTASLTATGCIGQLSWSGEGLSAATSVVAIPVSPTITSGTVLSYTATCVLYSSTAVSVGTVTVVPIPVVSLSASPSTTVASGSSVSLTASGCQGGTLSWSMGSGFDGQTTVVVNPVATTVYSASCVSGPGCVGTGNITIDIYAPAVVSVNNTTVCAGGTASLTATGCAGQLSWSGNGVSGTSPVLSIPVSPTITTTTILSYSATCVVLSTTAVSVGTVTVVPIPVVSLSASPNTTVASGSSVSLTASGCQGGTLSWSMGSAFDGQTTVVVSPVATTVYSASCVSGPGCVGTGNITIDIYAPAGVSVTNTTVCAGGTASLTATGCAGQLSWSGNGVSGTSPVLSIPVSPTITTTTILNYSATCVVLSTTAVSVGTVTVVPVPVVSLSASPNTTVASGSSVSLTASGCQGGTLSWSMGSGFDGQTTVVVTPVATTVYSASCVSGPGCVGTGNITIDIYAPAVVSVNNTTVCAGGTASLTATGCAGQLSWSGNGVSGTTPVLSIPVSPTITTTTILSYSATCVVLSTTAVSVGTVTVVPNPVFTVLSTTCAADGKSYIILGTVSPVSATVSVSAGTLSQSGNSFTVSNIASGSAVTLALMTSGGCIATQTVASPVCQTLCPVIAVTTQASSQTAMSGGAVDLYANVTPAGSYSYAWSAPAGVTLSSVSSPTVTTSALPVGIHTFTAVVTTVPGCSTYTTVSIAVYAPLTPALIIRKLVDRSEAQVGGLISYTLVLQNLGTGPSLNDIVRDSLTTNAVVIPGSVTTSVGQFTTTASGFAWAVPGLPVNGTATVVYSASVLRGGSVRNTATVPTDTAEVCVSVPFIVCKGSDYAFRVNAPAGYLNYKFLRNGTLVYEGSLNSYTATTAGEYTVLIDEQGGACASGSCCPVIIREDSIPSFSLTAANPTCRGTVAQADGRIQLSGLDGVRNAYTYRYSAGSTFNETTAGVAKGIPENGLLADTISTAGAYTVRIYNERGCYQDVTVTIQVTCTCDGPECVPIRIRKIK